MSDEGDNRSGGRGAAADAAGAITVGGLPGTGTSTLCRLLQERTGLQYVYAGQIFRDEAARRGMDLADFGRLCERDPSVDQALDEQQVAFLREGGLILEGRLSGWLAYRERIPALKVWITCRTSERVARIVEREGGDPDAQRARMLERQESEAERYKRYYGIDLRDMAPYDLVLDSTHSPPEVLAEAVANALAARTR